MKSFLPLLLLALSSCTKGPAENAKLVLLPFDSGKEYTVINQPFKTTDRGYAWDFGVPFGTPVVAMEEGEVMSVWEPEGGGGCEVERFHGKGHNIKILHKDGTVAQYLHIKALVKKGDRVLKGQRIAETANNGVVCTPNLYVTVWKSVEKVGKGPEHTLPLRFVGVPNVLLDGHTGKVP